MTTNTLQPQHEALINNSAISPDVAAARQYRTVTTKAELKSLGFGESQRRVPTLLLPVWGVTGEIKIYQIRPDQPRVGKLGKLGKLGKFLNHITALRVAPRASVLHSGSERMADMFAVSVILNQW